MKQRVRVTLLMLSAVLITMGCGNGQPAQMSVTADRGTLGGAWRSKIVFRNGSLAGMKDLEFLYAYHTRRHHDRVVQLRRGREFLAAGIPYLEADRPATIRNEVRVLHDQAAGSRRWRARGGDWWPSGHGVLTETITLSDDGETYVSTIKLTTYDRTGAPIAGGGEGTGAGTRIVF